MGDNVSYRIRPVRAEDIPVMARLLYRAFGHNAVHAAFWPEHLKHLRTLPGREDHVVWRTTRLEKSFREGKPWLRFIVAVRDDPEALSEEGKEVIIGCAEWVAPKGNAEAVAGGEAPSSQEPDLEERLAQLPPGIDKDVVKAHSIRNQALEKKIEEFVGATALKDMWTLNSIAVDPDYQGKGIGTRLTRWGVEQSEAEGKDIYLLASSDGALLYRKMGFTDVANSDFLGETSYAMIRRSGQQSKGNARV